jgi:hypothetical protein
VAAWAERPLACPRLISATPAQREHDARLLGAGDPLRQDGPREGDDDRVEREESTETTLTSRRVEAAAKSTAVSARSAFFQSSRIALLDDQAQ